MKPVAKYAVFAKLPSGKTVSLWVTAEDTVLNLRNTIAEQASMDKNTIAITYAGKLLQDDATVGSAKIGKEAIIHVMVRKAPAPQAKSKKASSSSPSSKVKGGESYYSSEGSYSYSSSSSSSSCSPSSSVPEPSPEEEMDNLITSFASGVCTKGVDICFIFDTTGSMASVIEKVRTQIKKTCTRLCNDLVGIRISIMAVGDYCDQANYVVNSLDFSNNPSQIHKFVSSVKRTGGGDAPEAYEWALHKARQLSWRTEEDVGKAVVLIADAEPHPPSYTSANIFWQDELEMLADMGVKVYGVQALHTGATPFYQRLAERSGGLHIRFNNFHLITEMFLAVCYREAGEEKLQEFREKNEEEKNEKSESKDGEMEEIMETLARPLEQKKEVESKINCTYPWYTGKCQATPSYYYCSEKDKFTPWANRKNFKNEAEVSTATESDKGKEADVGRSESKPVMEAHKKRERGFSFSSWFPW
eukprot:CAMPEP_0201522374 /NCGR_PEP_ID=MMETSP0161_2-20130828/17150_1 /ASSEMBLY_ACC=CAM_ASM_000251 /TAXON_ID=180227 /ORGANISM="Neoparamoeba aestuarina, Strain SoJaBio B1-5/56/2" /LENGTH=472 /DNA_ID=CAMNT_0047921197 /DNA_START=75 /DNA_END=1490 /DNA_ORIENTATION=+